MMTVLITFNILCGCCSTVVYLLLVRKLSRAERMYGEAQQTLIQSHLQAESLKRRENEAIKMQAVIQQRLHQIESAIYSLN